MKAGPILTSGAVIVVMASLAACSDNKDSGSSSEAKTVKVQMTNDGCGATPDKVDAGPITFSISNTNAAAVSEVELIKDNRILAERENIAPGMAAVSFSHKLDGGTYQLYCPGASNEKTTFTVTGKAADATGSLASAVDKGNLQAAQAAYPKARPYYERIEPVAGAFCTNGATDCSDNNSVSLDFAIDARPAAVGRNDTWTGFHVLEKSLFQTQSLSNMKPVADKLLSDAKQLRAVVNKPAFAFTPSDIINGAGDLLDEVSTTKLTGEEEFYSHIDVLDMQANVEGSEQAFAMVKPALNQIDPQLTATITNAFANVDKYIDSFRDAGQPGGFKLYTQLTPEEKRSMAQAVIAVKDPLAQAGGKIAAAS